ncbi:MAG: M13 family peptidase, partial [Ruminococcus sp.]|nr:M13 family peptidase [Ruminococcus sp.]
EVDMSAAEFNAQYLPCNCINITVAIMQKPMFDPEGDNAVNLGALGSVVGHEIGHAFDSNCINYNADGIYDPSWLNDADLKVLKERADVLSDYYSKFTIMEVYHVDGELTNGENYADLSGIECVTNLVDDEEELKKLFKSYAESWSTLAVDSDAISTLKLDSHSPAKVRVNAVLASNKKFNEVYDLKEGDGMYIAPEERVSRW